MSIIEDMKSVAEVIQKAGNLDLYTKMLELQIKASELVQENHKLREEKVALQETLRLQGDLKLRRDAYWKESGEGPFCVPCWQKDTKAREMVECDEGDFRCTVCGFVYQTERCKQREEELFRRLNDR